MATRREKWQLHGTVLGVLGAVIALVATLLLNDAHARHGLDGLGSALVGGLLLMGLAIHAVISTLIVALAPDRRGVALAHAVFPATLAILALAVFTYG